MELGYSSLGLDSLGSTAGAPASPPAQDPPNVSAQHAAPWSSPSLLAAATSHAAPWAVLAWQLVNADHAAPWALGALTSCQAQHLASWATRTHVGVQHSAPWSAPTKPPVAAQHRAPWTCPDASIVLITGEHHITHVGQRYAIVDARVSIDEGGSVWNASIALLEAADYARVAIGDAFTLTLWGQDLALVCDGRRLSRSDAAPSYTLTALSPAALLSAPWADEITLGTAGLARARVEAVLGQALDWPLPDWALPASAAELSGTPLALAAQIASAAGGLIESSLDGTLYARARYPVSLPDYPSTAPVAALTDRDLLGHSDSAGAAEIANRRVITSGDPETTADQIQITAEQDPEDAGRYTVRAYPWPWRDVTLVHTGDAATQIGAREEAETEHSELIEIKAGAGGSQHPIHAIVSSRYQHADLGALSTDGTAITTASADYSQLDLTYRARCWAWTVTNATVETIQFLALE